MGLRRVVVSRELVTEIMTEGWAGAAGRCVEGLPPGAELWQVVGGDHNPMLFTLVFRHPDWPDLPPDSPDTFITPTYSRDEPGSWRDRSAML